MRIWLINIGEQLPIDDPNERLLRTGILANLLADRGHEVVWWTSSFDHIRKKHRVKENTAIVVKPGLTLQVLHGPGYYDNVSLRRILNHALLSRGFRHIAPGLAVPDIVVSSLPAIEISVAAADYAQKRRIPLLLDVRDLWPDIFAEVVPGPLKPFVRLASRPFESMLRSACTRATGIMGITPAFVEWGLQYAGRAATPMDRSFPLAYTAREPSPEARTKAEAFWDARGIKGKDANEFTACFISSAGRHVDLQPVAEAARRLLAEPRYRVRFVICGNLGDYEQYFTGCENVLRPGWVGAAELWTILRRSSVGLVAYQDRADFQRSYPNKSIEYLSAALPVVSRLSGSLKELLERNECGLTYGTSAELAAHLRTLYDDPARRDRMSVNAGRLFREQFVAETVYSDMCSHFAMVIARGTQADPPK